MESRFLIKKCMLKPNGTSLDEDFDIVRGNPIVDYYESITSPSIAMTISFIDIDQVISKKGITGGELIDFTTTFDDFDDFKITAKQHRMVLNSVRDVFTDTNKQTATLEFVSEEAMINETSRVNKKSTGNVSDTVEDLLRKDKKGIRTRKKLFKDRSANTYSFCNNLKRPFDTIQWLCPKTQASRKNFGFLFYETLDGYHFKSIEKLLKQKPIRYEKPDRPTEGSFRILENNLNQSNDMGLNLRMGMYANNTIFVDLENQSKSIETTKTEDIDLNKKVKLPKILEDKPTRLMFRLNDPGVAQKGGLFKRVQPRSELAVYQNKSYIRNNLLFSQSLSLSIPLNPDLRAGQMLDIRLPLKKGDNNKEADTSSYGSEKDNDISGRYLIAKLRHLIGGGKSETQLTLVRDVFTA